MDINACIYLENLSKLDAGIFIEIVMNTAKVQKIVIHRNLVYIHILTLLFTDIHLSKQWHHRRNISIHVYL